MNTLYLMCKKTDQFMDFNQFGEITDSLLFTWAGEKVILVKEKLRTAIP